MQVVSISSLKGGVGKTSVTTGLASAALAAGIPTLVVDLDPHADATTALGVQPGDQLDIGRMLKSPRRAKLADNVVGSSWTARALSNGSGPGVLDVAVGSAYTGIYDRPDLGRRDLRRLSSVLAGADYELVLIDCPPSLNGLTRMAWSASDKVALVAEPGLFSVAGTERTMRAIQLFRQEFAPNLSPAGIVANRVRTGSSEHTYRLAEMESMFGELLLSPGSRSRQTGSRSRAPPIPYTTGPATRRNRLLPSLTRCWPTSSQLATASGAVASVRRCGGGAR